MKIKLIMLFKFLSFSVGAAELDCGAGSTASFNKCIVDVMSFQKLLSPQVKQCDEVGERPQAGTSSRTRTQAAVLPLDAAFFDEGADCSNFISRSSPGRYGNAGAEVVNYLNDQGDDSIYFSNNLNGFGVRGNICPRWQSLTRAEKEHFWVWTFAAIAYDEAKCRPDARNPNGTNGVAIGLMQLDQKLSGRKWRGPNCKVPNVSGVRDNIRCGMDIMGELLLGRKGEYQGSGLVFSSTGRNTSYWEKLKRKGGGGIGELIRKHPLCQGRR